uniref:Major facilitator superfamily (MFS) profile domain-containing protein n=1 Tax=Graphocephala atropunctata TaxID=36148 RepID=A0A1B6LE48_9HEMI
MKFLKAFCACIPQRYFLCVFIVLGMVVCYLMRVCLVLALNEMTFRINRTETSSEKHQFCPMEEGHETRNQTRAEFHWDQRLQHDIIKALYFGYIIAHVPAGVIADTLGGKHVFGGGILVSAFLSLSFPTLARLSPYAFMAGRVIQGFGQGCMFPSTSALVAKWAPPNERSTMTGIVQTGVMFGNAIGYMTSGVILGAFPSWEPIFYIVGIIGLLWCFGWYPLCYSTPANHPFVTDKEKTMIQTMIQAKMKKKPKKIPWSSILTSVPFITAVMINFGHAWALFTMVNEMPNYMGKVLNFNVQKSGLFSALPHIAMIPTSIGCGYLCDWILKKNLMTITLNRKVFSFFANTLPIPFMLMASYSGCDRTMVIIYFMIMMFFKGMSYSTCRVLPVDLSPNYAGILMGIMNGVGSFAGLLSPVVTPFFLKTGDGSIEEWRNVFYTAAVIMTVFSVPFLFFGSGELQPWNDIEMDPEPTPESVDADKPAEEAKTT